MANFQLFFQSGRAKDLTVPLYSVFKNSLIHAAEEKNVPVIITYTFNNNTNILSCLQSCVMTPSYVGPVCRGEQRSSVLLRSEW